jgi:hypothetical protein
MQKMPLTTMMSIARGPNAWTTIAPMTDSANVMPFRISEKNIGASILGLCVALEAASGCCKSSQVHIIVNCD